MLARRVRDLSAAMRRANEALGASYLKRREADVDAAVASYARSVATATGGPPAARPAAVSAQATGVGGGGGGAGALLPGPSGLSAGCGALLQLLVRLHNQALAYSPGA